MELLATLLLAASLLAGAALAASPGPNPCPSSGVTTPSDMMPSELERALPVLELAVAVRLLFEATAAPRPAPAQARAVRAVLEPLQARERLGPEEAARVAAELERLLTEGERRDFAGRRAALERQAQLRLAQSRFAVGEAPSPAANRYAFLVPGGAGTIAAANRGENPFLAGPNARVLAGLLERLGR